MTDYAVKFTRPEGEDPVFDEYPLKDLASRFVTSYTKLCAAVQQGTPDAYFDPATLVSRETATDPWTEVTP